MLGWVGLPTTARWAIAQPYLEKAYARYSDSSALTSVLKEDASLRFASIRSDTTLPAELASAVVNLVEEVAELRNLVRL